MVIPCPDRYSPEYAARTGAGPAAGSAPRPARVSQGLWGAVPQSQHCYEDGMPEAGGAGCWVENAVTLPVAESSVTRTPPWGIRTPFLIIPM